MVDISLEVFFSAVYLTFCKDSLAERRWSRAVRYISKQERPSKYPLRRQRALTTLLMVLYPSTSRGIVVVNQSKSSKSAARWRLLTQLAKGSQSSKRSRLVDDSACLAHEHRE